MCTGSAAFSGGTFLEKNNASSLPRSFIVLCVLHIPLGCACSSQRYYINHSSTWDGFPSALFPVFLLRIFIILQVHPSPLFFFFLLPSIIHSSPPTVAIKPSLFRLLFPSLSFLFSRPSPSHSHPKNNNAISSFPFLP